MGTEIERKFLVEGDAWRGQAEGVLFRQGYLSSTEGRIVRVRVARDRAFLTVKGRAEGIARPEFEYEVPLVDGEAMLLLAERPLIEKVRYRIPMDGFVWEVDEFFGGNGGLVVAEIELERADQPFPRPEWLGREVTGDPRYLNSNLMRNPYRNWKDGA